MPPGPGLGELGGADPGHLPPRTRPPGGGASPRWTGSGRREWGAGRWQPRGSAGKQRQGPNSRRLMETLQGASERGRVLCPAGPGGEGPAAWCPGAHRADPPAAAAGACAAPRPPRQPGAAPSPGSAPTPQARFLFPAPPCTLLLVSTTRSPGPAAGGCGPRGWGRVGASLQLWKPS